MTLLSFFLHVWIVFWYGAVLLLYYLFYIPLLGYIRNFEILTFIFLLMVILTTFAAILLLGGIITSVGLVLVGLTCAFSSVLLNRGRLTIILFLVYAISILVAFFAEPYLKAPSYLTSSVNNLYYVMNILWITGTTLMFILFYIKQQSQIEIAEASRLKELDEAKTRLYTHITHEFRTPLTIILGITDLVEKRPEKWHKEGIREIRRNSNSLLQLVNQMLDLSKLEEGLMLKNLVNGDIIHYLKYLIESFNSLAENRQIQLTFSSPLVEFDMDYDPENLMHILSNLLANALKYTPEGGKVKVYAGLENQSRQKKERLLVRVEDTGIGIKQENLQNIFDRFYRLPDGISSSSGSGLGLALTKELVHMLNGEITVISIPEKGTIFSILLPITQTASRSNDIDNYNLKKSIAPYIDSTGGLELSEKWDEIKTTGQPIILIVEDNRDVIKYLMELLKNKYDIRAASNGKEALEKAIKIIPDIVISDVMMPLMNGYELVDRLKKDIRTSHIPIILLTAKADITSKLQGLIKGADAYLAKPFNKDELLIRLEKLIEIRKRMQEHFSQFNHVMDTDKYKSMPLELNFMQKVRNILETHIHNENFGIETLCRELPMSRAQLYRKFNALTNLTVSKYIRSIRLHKAKQLLLTTPLDVSEVAFQVGFKNLSHFSSSFTQEFGINPSKIDRKNIS